MNGEGHVTASLTTIFFSVCCGFAPHGTEFIAYSFKIWGKTSVDTDQILASDEYGGGLKLTD